MLNRLAYIAFSKRHSWRTCRPAFDEVFGKARSAGLSRNPEEAALFQRAMIALSQGNNEVVAEADVDRVPTLPRGCQPWPRSSTFTILERDQSITGVLFDFLPALDAAKTRVGSASGRIQFLGAGDFFDFRALAGADVYILKRVIHDWNNEQSAQDSDPVAHDDAPRTSGDRRRPGLA